MKWLVKTLDHLLGYAGEDEANVEQRKLEDLIARYKNLIPTIEITMVKTEVFSKCYTYRREVHEVVNLLSKVREQAVNIPAPDSLERVNKLIEEQQYAINQLDHQRPHIMSMLQRGRDLSKDVHAPSFVQVEVKNLETGWNQAYTETSEKLHALKGTQAIWNEFADQKSEIVSMLHVAETELRALTPLQTDPKNVSQDLKAKRELNAQLQQASHQLLPKLHTLKAELSPLAATEKRPILEKEVTEVEKMFFNTMEHVKDRVSYLEDYSGKWNNYKARLAELQEWANKIAPKSIEALHSEDLTPEERMVKVNVFKGVLADRMKQLDVLAADASELAPKEGNVAEAKRLKGEISKLQEVLSAISRNVDHQAQAAQEDLLSWQQFQTGLQQLKPIVEECEIKVNTIVPKPLSLEEAVALQQNAEHFETLCLEQIDRLQGISNISHKMLCKSNAPDEVDAMHSRWTAVYENAKQSSGRLEKLVSNWKSFEAEIHKLEEWVEKGEKMTAKKLIALSTPHIDKLENELVRLKSFNNEISEQQARLVALGQTADQISLHLAIEGAGTLKDNINVLKSKLQKLSETTRTNINELSDAIIARQDFNAKMVNFSNWMDQLRNQVAQVEDVNPERVEISLHVIHALMQEHADKKPSFNAIYDEVKQLSLSASPDEAMALNEAYSALVLNYQNIETNMQQKKVCLEKWSELLNWKHETESHLNYLKHQIDKHDAPGSQELNKLIMEIDTIGQSMSYWKNQAKEIEENPVVQLKDALSRRPLIATQIVNDIENKLENLQLRSQNQKHQLEQIQVRKNKFHSLEGDLTQALQSDRLKLTEILKRKPSLISIDQIINDLLSLNDALKLQAELKNRLHDEGAQLMREDITSMPVIQDSLLHLDKDYESLQSEIDDRIQKYQLINQALHEYADIKNKFSQELQKATDLYNAIPGQPRDEIKLHQAAEKTRKTTEQLRKVKTILDEFERKGNYVAKLFNAIGEAVPQEIPNDLTVAKQQCHDLHDKTVKNIHMYETEAVFWSQIEDAKKDLIPWLSETNQGLCDAADNSIEIEFAPVRLTKYHTELPSYQALRDTVIEKSQELIRINDNNEIPALTALNQLLNDQFREVENNANRLNAITTMFNDHEQELRQKIKYVGENVNKFREQLIKCDDLSGDNAKVVERLQKCRILNRELSKTGNDIDNIKLKVDELRALYPTFSESIVPKELNNVQKRYEGVEMSAKKIENTLLQFLKKFHTDKVGMLKRLIATQREKVAWCQPETSSDKYNLDVKKSSLHEVSKALDDCRKRQAEVQNTFEMLKAIDTPQNIAEMTKDVDLLNAEMRDLENSFNKIENILEENVDLWSQYERANEEISSWLRDIEARIKVETSSQVNLQNIPKKLQELTRLNQDIKNHEPVITNLEKTSHQLVEKNPEARIGQFVNHLVQRYQTITKSLAAYVDKILATERAYNDYNKALEEATEWLSESKIEFQELARMGSPGSSSATAQQLQTIKNYLNTFDNGQKLINNAVDIGEGIYPIVLPENREKIRTELRGLREKFDYLRDEANALLQQVEAVLIQKTTIEESYTQVSHYLNESKAKAKATDELYPTLAAKKSALQNYKIQLQEATLHKNALKQLQEKAVALYDDESERKTEESIHEYNDLSRHIAERINVVSDQVVKHEAYDQVLEKAQDWLNTIKSEAFDIINETTFEKEGAEEKLIIVENLLQHKPEGDSIFNACHKLLQTVLYQTHPSGHPALLKSFQEPKNAWDEFVILCQDSLVKLKQLCSRWDEFEAVIGEIDSWMKNVESNVKNQSLKNTASSKRLHLQQLQSIAGDIEKHAKSINDLMDRCREIEGETDLNLKLSRLNTRYQTLKNLCKESIAKYQIYAKDHESFDQDYEVFKKDLELSLEELAQCKEVVGDQNILQERQNKLRDLLDKRINDGTVFENLIDRGEKLYGHTSPEGREIIRQQLRSLRSIWDGYTEDLNAAAQTIDQCLQYFNEFAIAQDQLTKWLKDVDKAMQSHTEPKTTLQEKRAQLQNHKMLHQEITTHNVLVDNVCEKAQTLIDKLNDNSLNIYLQSIKQLYNGIVQKSAQILENLQDCVDQHAELNNKIISAKSWMSAEKEKLLECDDAYGEKTDIKRKIETLNNLAQNKPQALTLISSMRNQYDKIEPATSQKGNDVLKKEISELEITMKSHFDDIEGIESKQKEVLQQWNNFENKLEDLTKWCRTAEAIFREQQLQSTLHEKVEELEKYKIQRDLILQKEKEVDAFADAAHILLNNCGADRLKNLTAQFTNRYQLLQVLSKEVVNRWTNLVDDHQMYQDKYNEVDLWLQPIEKQLQQTTQEDTTQISNILQVLLAEREHADSMFAALNAAGEKALPETSTQGREKLRKEMRDIRDRWDKLDEGIRNLQKRQEAQSLQLSNYHEILGQVLNWLDQAEKGVENENPASWTNAQDTRSKMYKFKAISQDINSHKRIVEAVNEKASILCGSASPANATEIQKSVDDINKRYNQVATACNNLLRQLEEAFEVYQQFSELQKSQQDYQKNLWDRLTGYSDYSGNKPALQARLNKVIEIQNSMPESMHKLQALSDHIDQHAKLLPARSKETMARDLSNLYADYEKFSAALSDVKSGLENRLQQWSDYEVNLDQLIAWLGETENALKNYNLKGTLEEKEDQLNRFQTLVHNLRQREMEFEKLKDESSELIQSSGETRISVNVQQVTSRFQSIQATIKEIMKKCEQSVHDHVQFNEKYKQCSDWFANAQAKYDNTLDLSTVATREDLLKKQLAVQELLAQQSNAALLLNNTIELGEKCYASSASEGREAIRLQLEELQKAFDQLFDNLNSHARKIQDKMSKWSGFDEIAEKLKSWLIELERALPAEIELKTTLDEKRGKLLTYRDALNDINNHKAEIGNLQEIAGNLPEKTEHVDEATKQIVEKYEKLKKRAENYVRSYEEFVSAHQQYCKAVMDTQEFIESTHDTIDYWGNLDLEQVSLHTNLDRLRNLKSTLADEFPRVDQVRVLGEKVIPGTVASGQINIKTQIGNTQQEWEGLITALNSAVEGIETRLQNWADYEQLRDNCLDWIREADNKLHSIDLKPNLAEKKTQLEELKTLQGEVRAKELEVDNVSEKAQLLMKGPSGLRTSGPELITKYQQLFHKVKELNSRWQQYVASHQEFENSISECTAWISSIKEKLEYCADTGSMGQKELDKKMNIIHDVILLKDEGSAKVQGVVELAQNVLANTAPIGHDAVNKQLTNLQDLWSSIALRIVDVKSLLDDSITQWSGFLEQVQNVSKFNDWLESTLKELSEHQTSMTEKRAQLDRVRTTEEKVRMEKIDVDALKSQAKEIVVTGQQSQTAFQAQKVFERFDELATRSQKLLSQRQDQYRDHRLYKEAYDDLLSWISRAREKFPSLKQGSLSDKLAIESAVQATENMLNKQAQGELLVEHLVHTGEVVLASTSPQGQEIIRNDIRSLRDSFEGLFRDINQQKENLEATMQQWRAYKEEYERLIEWLQQIDILVKNHKLNLQPNLAEKEKQVTDMRDIMSRLEKGKDDIDRFNNSAAGLLKSHLDTYVSNQLRHLNSMYQVQVNLAKDVLKKVETNCDQHREYKSNMEAAKSWINHAKDVIRECSEASSARSKDVLEERLEKVQELLRNREFGQNLVHTAINNGEKVVRNTRSDGREPINNEMKELQNDWERLVKKLSTAKVQLETNLLQWADYSSSYSQLQQWILDKEAKLQQVSEPKVVKSKRNQQGLSSGLSERKANLRQTNNIVQDIVSFEPMIQSVTSKASDLQQGAPASEISSKYQTLTKQAQDIYEKQKNTIDQYQAFIDSGNDFATWLRNAKERLSKCSEPTGDKQALAEKTHQLKILQGEVPQGQKKLEAALTQAEIACRNAEPEDCEIIEQEVALLQEEFDTYVENLQKTKVYLEVGIVKWSDYQDQYSEALDWLTKTETLVQSYNKLQESLAQKKIVLEEFQGHLQTLFDWQKTLDHLNMKAQMLLETCSDTRISNAVMQLTTKYNALLTLAKEVMRRLEMHYQEHQQHNTLYQECQSWIEQTREKLTQCEIIPGTLNEVQIKLNTVKNLRQGFESGQNKLRYLLELKEKVIINTEQTGAAKIQEDTESLKQDYDNLLIRINDVRQKLMNRLSHLEEIYKLYKGLEEWLEEIRPSLKTSGEFLNDLSEKRAALEKFRSIQRDFNSHNDIVEKISKSLKNDDGLDNKDFQKGLNEFEELQMRTNEIIESLENHVNNHDKYKQALLEIQDWLRKARNEIELCSDCHGEQQHVEDRLNKLGEIDESMVEGKSFLDACKELGQAVIATSGNEGQDAVTQEIKHLITEWEAIQAMSRDARYNLELCLTSWNTFQEKINKINVLIEEFNKRLARANETENKTPEDLINATKLLQEVVAEKENVEELNDTCELLMERSACSRVRDQTVDTQAKYTKLLTNTQGLVARIEKNLSDHTEFLNYKNEMDAWILKAQEILNGCNGKGDMQSITQQIETINALSSRLPEGQHLLGIVQDTYNRASNVLPEDKQEKLREMMTKVRESWDALGLAVKQKLNDLKQNQNRWAEFLHNKDKLEKWLTEMEETLKFKPNTKGELSEMKTQLERYKVHQNDIKLKGSDMEHLCSEAKNLNVDIDEVQNLQELWGKVKNDCNALVNRFEDEVNEYNAYHQTLQDVEKWLLQISFQLMAHNSLLIANRQQTQEQIKQHEALLDEIQKYQTNIDDLNAKGQCRIKRYETSAPAVRLTVETQLKNIQDSYSSLLQTSVQIRNRLQESLAKFQEYEDTLESIMRNLQEYEPIIKTELDTQPNNLEMAQNQLKCAQNMQNKLNFEKSRLAIAVQACEAATASISRPSSPLETAMQVIPERELMVRSELEDLLDQKPNKRTQNSTTDANFDDDVELNAVTDYLLDAVANERLKKLKNVYSNRELVQKLCTLKTKVQSHLSGLIASVGELEQQQKQRAELADWISKQQVIVSDWMMRPCKLRPEAAKQELMAMDDLLNAVGDKRSHLMLDLTGSLADDENDLIGKIDKLETQLMDAIAKKKAGQNIIDSYRQSAQDMNNWFDSLIKRMDVLDKGSGLNCAQKMTAITEVKKEYEEQGPQKLQDLKSKAAQVAEIISNLDGQQVKEQMKSYDRRYLDLGKRLDRKAQLLDVTNKCVEAIKAETDQLQNWVKETLKSLQTPALLGYEPKSGEARQHTIKSIMKEAESKQSLTDALEKRIANMQSELEPAEYAQLGSALRNLNTEQKNLSAAIKLEMEKALEATRLRKIFENDLEKARNWLKAKISKVRQLPGYHPLTALEVENKLQENKRFDDEAKQFNDTVLSDLQRQAINIMKDCPETEKASLQKILDEIEADYKILKDECGNRANTLGDLLQGRKAFEKSMKQMTDWLNEMETATEGDLRTSNLPVLEEQLAHYHKLLKKAENMDDLLNDINEQGKGVSPSLSNPDKLKLNDDIKSMKDRFGKVKQTLNNRVNTLGDHIKKYKDAKSKLAEFMEFLNRIQQRLRELNKPIGAKIEDVQELLRAYEGILKELKDSKHSMGDMEVDDLPELQSILSQQDDMIKLIEDQLAHLRQLLLLREQFIALINEIIAFIMKYTDVLVDIENAPDSLEEKINKYDDVIVKIQECEGLLASANDKGQKIASEGTAADKNSITEQLQSLKNQLGNLRKAVEQQRQRHQIQLEHHKKMATDLMEILDWLHNTEGVIKSRPLLDRDPDSVEHELQKHHKLCGETQEYLDKFNKINGSVKSEMGMPGALLEMLSEGRSLVSSLPPEMTEREKYMINNRDSRLAYMKLVAEFNAWLHEAEDRLQCGQHGIDYEHLMRDLEEHKLFFGNEALMRSLVHKQIQEAADKIWPSLNNYEQTELSGELAQFQTKLTNVLARAKTQQADLEREHERFREYQQSMERVKTTIELTKFPDESVNNLAGLHFNIQKLTHAMGNVMSQTSDISLVNQQAQALIREADARNRQLIEQDNAQLNRLWQDLIKNLEQRLEKLQTIADKWDSFENRLLAWEKALSRLSDKFRNVDPVVRSRRHLEETKHVIQVSTST
uniref:KASH domain-containing protein n=1 Tax=Glossina palpalis gambiensis TaxID=67801 RepID=A0A1B0C1F9_9MUSC